MRKISRRSFLAGAALCGAAAALTACGGSSASSTAASSVAASSAAAGSAAAAGDSYTVGICQLVEHAALDAATQGFEDALSAEFGENVTFDFQNAQNDSATCATIANGFVSSPYPMLPAEAPAPAENAAATKVCCFIPGCAFKAPATSCKSRTSSLWLAAKAMTPFLPVDIPQFAPSVAATSPVRSPL